MWNLGGNLWVSAPHRSLQIPQCGHWPLGSSGSSDIHVWGFFPKCPDTQSPLVPLHLQKAFLGYSPDPGTFAACWWKRFFNCGNLQRLHILQMTVQTPSDSKCGIKWTEVIPLVWHVWDSITTTHAVMYVMEREKATSHCCLDQRGPSCLTASTQAPFLCLSTFFKK